MKEFIKSLIEKTGYRVSRVPEVEIDAYGEMKRLMKEVKNPVIFDVGAHHGDVTRDFRKLFTNSTIYAFEPFMESYKELKKNTQSDPNIHAYNFGLGDEDGSKEFFVNEKSSTNSLLQSDSASDKTWGENLLTTKEAIKIEIRKLDSVIEKLKISHIDILKLDVQGAEYLVLSGAQQAARDSKISLLYTEIITLPTYVGQKRFDEMLGIYYNSGLNLHGFYNMSRTKFGQLRQLDAIFTNIK